MTRNASLKPWAIVVATLPNRPRTGASCYRTKEAPAPSRQGRNSNSPPASALGNGQEKAEPWKGRYKAAARDRPRRTQFRAAVNSILGRRREWALIVHRKENMNQQTSEAVRHGCIAMGPVARGFRESCRGPAKCRNSRPTLVGPVDKCLPHPLPQPVSTGFRAAGAFRQWFETPKLERSVTGEQTIFQLFRRNHLRPPTAAKRTEKTNPACYTANRKSGGEVGQQTTKGGARGVA